LALKQNPPAASQAGFLAQIAVPNYSAFYFKHRSSKRPGTATKLAQRLNQAGSPLSCLYCDARSIKAYQKGTDGRVAGTKGRIAMTARLCAGTPARNNVRHQRRSKKVAGQSVLVSGFGFRPSDFLLGRSVQPQLP
jgi:hypothetical protein